MELWSIECVVVIWAILQGATSVGVINAEQCVSPHNNSNFAGSFEAHGYAHLFRANSNLVSNNGKVCVAFSSIRNGNIWNITMNYGAEAGDKISGLLAGFGQFSTFGLRDSEVIFIEACNETARFGFEESGGPAEICFNYEDIISFNRSWERFRWKLETMPNSADTLIRPKPDSKQIDTFADNDFLKSFRRTPPTFGGVHLFLPDVGSTEKQT
ncbi:hypothetical protein CpipJ_CPIJ007362 [Culex quinquefasciatus]|uniref:Secreted protein n=1 Tax=Culex quinquefasciatus TaxID=7176 RepID=B0WKD0_CULQU|nr:hypothetical protein CpipJ_CPIJ007362 [Culex quinquefasciatus]|eukprot:XP_001849164.1 hypothetical protein CpipJ_CPIJ007362 [Culex quinquefasciatus]